MNKLLQLKGTLNSEHNRNSFGSLNLPRGKFVTSQHMRDLVLQLGRIKQFWEENKIIEGALISVHYIHIIAKSNRIKVMLAENSKSPNESIRGSKFGFTITNGKENKNHIFTHYVKLEVIEQTIEQLNKVIQIIESDYLCTISHNDIEKLDKKSYKHDEISRTRFIKFIIDSYYVDSFGIDEMTDPIKEQSIVTIFKTDVATNILLGKLGIDMINAKKIDETTLRLAPDEINLIQTKAPYLISMAVKDMREITKDSIIALPEQNPLSIPSPKNEPIVGVLDTQFDKRVYFGDWVEYTNMIDEQIELKSQDYVHGTEISSIIVDGPSFNPDLEDGCGRFRVRHFGIARADRFSSFSILKMIRQIVSQNRDIKVWNLSLGSALEINQNFISPEAAELDKLQNEFDVIFVIAGTNNNSDSYKEMRVGAPADSINSLVVNSVKRDGNKASYTRTGPVLSFFHKPDVSYYGGDINEPIRVCAPLGEAQAMGTSFAAPWISRKLAYLMEVVGLSRETAKALIIDAAAGWNRKDDISHTIGYGIVPIHINDILNSPDDEIKFMINGIIEDFETYTYNIPVPRVDDKYPYFARATLCYFPKTSRNQGVDYTSTEMDIHFGRICEVNGRPRIKTINDNNQSEEILTSIYEEDARKLYRKWDNTKHISELLKERSRPRKSYGIGMWGLGIKTKERLNYQDGKGLKFGVVITLKEMNGVNRINDFIKMCQTRGWIVNTIDVDNQIDIYNKGEEIIEFE